MSKEKLGLLDALRDPKYHLDALKALRITTNNFKEIWIGNRTLHKKYEMQLVSQGIKRDNISDSGSGGRTWVAMLRTFGYVYIDTYTKKLIPTKVGSALLQGKKIRENVTKQILNLQIPNAYFLSSSFRPKFEDTFRIRPARFLIKLANQLELNFYLTKEEITFFALSAQKDTQILEVTQKIKEFRIVSEEEKEKIRTRIALDFDHRKRSDKGARAFKDAYGDVAHTFMLLCHYTELVEYIRGDALRISAENQRDVSKKISEIEKRYPFNNRYKISFKRFAENAGLDIDSYKATSFRNIPPAANRTKNINKAIQILSDSPVIQSLSKEEIAVKLKDEFSSPEANHYAELLVEHEFNSLNEGFVDSYLNELDPREFENKTASILKAIGFKVDLRPKLSNGLKTEIEIVIHIDDKNICLIDAKNYRKKFSLTASLASHMSSEYIPNYQGDYGKSVSSFGYITSNKWAGEKNLARITDKTQVILLESDIKGALIQAKALLGFLDYCLDNDIDMKSRCNLFMSCFTNKGYNDFSDMISDD